MAMGYGSKNGYGSLRGWSERMERRNKWSQLFKRVWMWTGGYGSGVWNACASGVCIGTLHFELQPYDTEHQIPRPVLWLLLFFECLWQFPLPARGQTCKFPVRRNGNWVIQLKKLYNNCIFRCVKANSRFNMIPTLVLAQWFRLAQSRNFLSTPCSLLLVTWVPPQNSILVCIPHGVVLSVRRSSIFGPTLTTRTGSG